MTTVAKKRESHMEAVAIRKACIEGWEPHGWEMVGEDVIVIGGIPRLLKSGPRKGRKTWDGAGTKVIVTRAEEAAEYARYVAETGNCGKCFGTGETVKSWHHIDGTTMQQCSKCAGSGRAPLAANPSTGK